MADQTIFTSSDTTIGNGGNAESAISINVISSGPNESNAVFRFDVSSLAGKMWDSAHLRLTFRTTEGLSQHTGLYIARCIQDVVITIATGAVFDTGMPWGSTYAEGGTDHDVSTRVNVSSVLDNQTFPNGTTITFLDITEIVKHGVTKDNGTLDLLLLATGNGTTSWHSREAQSVPESSFPNLFMTNVQDQETTTSSNLTGTASNVAVPSASVLSKSGRPPIAGADRQVSAHVIHDGVEPMKILSITLKGTFGTDN